MCAETMSVERYNSVLEKLDEYCKRKGEFSVDGVFGRRWGLEYLDDAGSLLDTPFGRFQTEANLLLDETGISAQELREWAEEYRRVLQEELDREEALEDDYDDLEDEEDFDDDFDLGEEEDEEDFEDSWDDEFDGDLGLSLDREQ